MDVSIGWEGELWLTVEMVDHKTGEIEEGWEGEYNVIVRVGGDLPTEDDTHIFYHYDNFDEILYNNALDFRVLAINGTCITEFDLKKGE